MKRSRHSGTEYCNMHFSVKAEATKQRGTLEKFLKPHESPPEDHIAVVETSGEKSSAHWLTLSAVLLIEVAIRGMSMIYA